jgi:hypothetical protein
MKNSFSFLLKKYLWLLCFFIGIIGIALSFLTFSYDREGVHLFQFLIHIFIFIVILFGISLFPNKFKLSYLLLFAPIVFYFSYIDPRLSYSAIFHQLDEFYKYLNIFLFPVFLYSICFAYRMGGGSSGKCLKTGLSGIILFFSGFLDAMWYIVNGINYATWDVTIPHIKVLFGFTPTFTGLLVFISLHIVLIVIVYILPFDKWLDKFFHTE